MESNYINKRRKFVGKIVSPSLNELENEFIRDGGSYREVKIEDIFEVKSSKKIFHANNLTIYETKSDNTYPYVVRSSKNNGIRGFIKENINFLNEGNTLSFAQDTFTIFYQTNSYFTGNKVKVLIPKIKFNEKIATYIITSINKTLNNYTWGITSDIEFIKNISFIIPLKNKKVDCEFIEGYINSIQEEHIKLLEQEREKQLNKYLSITELKDCELTEDEEDILNNSINIKYKEFELQELFISDTGDVDLQQKDINNKGYYFINSGVENCGIKGKTDRKAKIFNENTITIDFWGNAYYRNFKYKMATHNHVFSLCGDIIKNEKVGLYIVSKMSYIKEYFSYNNMGTWNKMKNLAISLPVNSLGEIDYDYMEKYITVIKKIIINEKAMEKDNIISNTKKVII